jgi:DNA polymerase
MVLPYLNSEPASRMATHDVLSDELHEAIANTQSLEDLYALMQESGFLGIQALSDGREVYWHGTLDDRIMFVIEEPQSGPADAPPLTGEDGELLEAMLASIMLSRETIFMAPLSPWPTPGGRGLTPAEIAAALPFMRRQIQLCNPGLLVLVGGNVARALSGSDASGFELRQEWLEYDAGDIIVPAKMLYHPGFLMKEVLQKEYAWKDLLEIRRVIDGGDPFAAPAPACG